MKIKLPADEVTMIEAAGTKNPDAYTLYLQSHRANAQANTKAEYDHAADYFRQSLHADPEFAEAGFFLKVRSVTR